MSFEELILKIMQAKSLKAAWSLIGGWLISYILPIAPFLIGVLILVSVDLYTGIQAAKKRNEQILSKGLRRSTIKIKDYFLAIILTHLVQSIWMPNVPIVYVVSAYIAITELKSNLENISSTTGINIWQAVGEFVKIKIPKK